MDRYLSNAFLIYTGEKHMTMSPFPERICADVRIGLMHFMLDHRNYLWCLEDVEWRRPGEEEWKRAKNNTHFRLNDTDIEIRSINHPRTVYLVTKDGYRILYEENPLLQKVKHVNTFDKKNATFFEFHNTRFVVKDHELWAINTVSWRYERDTTWNLAPQGTVFCLRAPARRIRTGSNQFRVSENGWEEVFEGPSPSEMIDKIINQLHDSQTVLEWVVQAGELSALMPDRAVRLGCRELLNRLANFEVIAAFHNQSSTRTLYRVVNANWKNALTKEFIEANKSEIERIYHEICKK